MSSKPAEPRSIASQLVLLFTLAGAFLLSCGLGALYWIVVRHAFEEDNEVLADKVAAVRADLSAPGGINVVTEELKSVRAGERAAYWVRIIDSTKRVTAETPGMTALLPTAVFADAKTPKDFHSSGRLFSLITSEEQTATDRFTVQVAQDRTADDSFMKQFAMLLAAVLALAVAASAIIAWSVTKRGLRPLKEMTRALKRVGPQQLHERVAAVGWPRELQPLAVAFDDMLARLEDSFVRLSQFSADIAHELRTPVGNIRGEAEVALTRSRSAEEYREVIESTIAECQHLGQIVDNLLFLARTEAAEGYLQRISFNGRAVVEKIAAFFEPIAEEQNLTIRCEGEGTFMADEMLFSRAVTNLVENAVHYTPAGGSIVISIGDSTVSVK
ncbi:MAG TPA: histidine kinase dimerization/phospho-acceptor domain-containing protein, partial [Chthoniobacterales bacterium]|nr:histidine kinase dimerization/phospho-acceptor domain-containing protein [Chthoniobacterales bacterium]